MRLLKELWKILLETHTIHVVWPILIPMLWLGAGAVWIDLVKSGAGWALAVLLACWVCGLITIGVYLYYLRCRHRLVYGLIETVAVIAIIAVTLIDTLDKLGMKQQAFTRFPWKYDIVSWLQLAAAIYILVRGLDNIGEGLAPGTRLTQRWEAVFPKRRQNGRAQ